MFLQLLRLLLPQLRFDVRAHVLEWLHFAALARFHFENVIVAADVDDFADLTGLEAEGNAGEFRRRPRAMADAEGATAPGISQASRTACA